MKSIKSKDEMMTIAWKEYEAQQQRINELEQQVSLLIDVIRTSRSKQFGASS